MTYQYKNYSVFKGKGQKLSWASIIMKGYEYLLACFMKGSVLRTETRSSGPLLSPLHTKYETGPDLRDTASHPKTPANHAVQC